MGLDMYLKRMPRFQNATAKDVYAIQEYLSWSEEKKNPVSEAKKYTLKEWTGVEEKDVMFDALDFYRHFYNRKYYYWDTEHKYGHDGIMEEVGYWRKANQIHNWFVESIQNGVDDCDYHREVTKEDLEELLDICHEILCNPDVAEDRLPTQGGFFFGSTNYDEYYIEDIKETMDIITKVLETTDFDVEMIYYRSSW